MPDLMKGTTRPLCALILTAAMLLNACSSWHPVTGSVPAAIETTRTDAVRVLLRDGRLLHVWDAHIENDSLMGIERHSIRYLDSTSDDRPRGYRENVVRVPVADVESVSIARIDRGRTALAIIGAAVVGFAILVTAAAGQIDYLGSGGAY